MSALPWEEPGALKTGPPPPPVPVSHGSYALYNTPEGGLHLVYRVKDAEEDSHMEIPPFVLSMARKAAMGQDLGPLAFLLGRTP